MTFPTKNSETLLGSVEQITFHNEENGFCVIKIKTKGHKDLITVIGNAVYITAGELVECIGSWVNNKEYGVQFKATNIQTTPPTTLEGMEKYLGSGLIKGIGKYLAKILIQAFGTDVFTIIENNPQLLTQLEVLAKNVKI